MQEREADPGPCPGENTIVELFGPTLPAERRAAIGAHVDRCPSCREVFALVAGSQGGAEEEEGGAPLGPGEQLGRYVLEELLGEGGMGAVYAARDPELDRRVAVKVIRPALAGLGDAVAARLAREARAMARVTHPNVVAVHDVGQADGRVFVAMELVAGTTLRAWLRARPRGWREVLAVFRAAGEGLAAAHAARLVHRDFKPDNVLIDGDGRVRVTDFGLARALADGSRGGEAAAPGAAAGAGEMAAPGAAAASPRSPASGGAAVADVANELTPSGPPGSAPLRLTLTGTGAMVGTPAYMAPEQHAQLPTDERADQFSFCVALWEALVGERPFAGRTALELADAALGGRIRPLPRRPRLPGWLRRALRRGLRPDPGERYPSMRELLDAIRSRRSRSIALVAAAGAVVAVGGGAALASAFLPGAADPGDRCAAQVDRVRAVWSEPRRESLRATMAGSELGAARWPLVEKALDRYAADWARMAGDVCQAAERGDQSAELRDLRVHCLDARLSDLSMTIGLLDTSDRTVADHALGMVDGMAPLERCSAVEMIEARVPQPDDPALRAQVDALRRELVGADAIRLAGRYREALAALESLAVRADALGYRPLVADVLYYLGEMQVVTGGASAGEATLKRAAHTALAGRYDQLAAEAWILLMDVATQSAGDLARAAEYAEHARAALERLGASTLLRGQFEQQMGILDWARSRPDDALGHFEAALALFRRIGEREGAIAAEEGLALIHEERGRLEDSLRINRAVFEARVELHGADHPHAALSRTNMAGALMLLGRHEEALAEMQLALATRQRTNGPEHTDTAQALHNVGEILRNLGRYEEALDHHRRAEVIFERELGSEHAMVAATLQSAGGVYLDLDRADQALPRLRRALAIYQEELGPDHADTTRARINLADGLRRIDRPREALAQDQAALDALGRSLGVDNVYGAHAEMGLGLDLVALGRLAEARPHLERAIATIEKTGEDAATLARARFGLARALGSDRSQRGRARELAASAAQALADAHGADGRLAREATGWLKAHRE